MTILIKEFSKYIRYNRKYQEQNGMYVKDFTNLGEKITKFREFTKSHSKILGKSRNISRFPHQQYKRSKTYTIYEYLGEYNEDILTVFFNSWTHHNVHYLETSPKDFIFAYRLGGWRFAFIAIDEFHKIFPAGLPQTEKEFERWLMYTCFNAKRHFFKKVEKEIWETKNLAPIVDNIVEQIKQAKLKGIDIKVIIDKATGV